MALAKKSCIFAAYEGCEGLGREALTFRFTSVSTRCFTHEPLMIDKSKIEALATEWLEGKAYFLTDINVSADGRIVVEIDHEEGVWIEDCVQLSKHIESGLDREAEDFELEVGSAGIGQPFKVKRQYAINIGRDVEVLTTEGVKYSGVLEEATEDNFVIITRQKQRIEGKKRPQLVDVTITFTYDEVKSTKRLISFK